MILIVCSLQLVSTVTYILKFYISSLSFMFTKQLRFKITKSMCHVFNGFSSFYKPFSVHLISWDRWFIYVPFNEFVELTCHRPSQFDRLA